MKLTRRQEQFIRKMIELKRESIGPIRYSLLAERLGVSPFTAYDMLCLLEEKGFVTSEYQLPADKAGPGRAERVFYPSVMAQAQQQQLVEQFGSAHLESEAFKSFALEKLSRGETPDQELTEQMMARLLSGGKGDVGYCVEVMTIAALRLKNGPGRQALLRHVPELLSGEDGSRRSNLCLLGGFVFGLLAQHSANTGEWLDKLREHLQGYLSLVMGMNAADCKPLAEELNRVITSLVEEPE